MEAKMDENFERMPIIVGSVPNEVFLEEMEKNEER